MPVTVVPIPVRDVSVAMVSLIVVPTSSTEEARDDSTSACSTSLMSRSATVAMAIAEASSPAA